MEYFVVILHQHLSVFILDFYLMVLKDMVEILLKMMADFLQYTISLITSAKMLHKSVALSASWVNLNSLFQRSASRPDGPTPPLVLILTVSASSKADLIGCASSSLSGNSTSGSALYLSGCIYFNCWNVFSVLSPHVLVQSQQ